MAVLTRTETAHFTETVIECSQVQTLAWHRGVLVDWAGGHTRIHLDGTIERGGYIPYGERFDAAISTGDGKHVVIYQRLGTKALLLRESKLVRELSRSYYCAEAYEYPVGFVCLSDGRTGLVHCPDEYDRLQIEDAVTGERLISGERARADYFHSRLSSNPSGTRFMSAGWIWHPIDCLLIFDVAEALRDGRVLDRLQTFPIDAPIGAEVSAAAWIDDEHIVVATPDEEPDALPQGAGPAHPVPRGLSVFDVTTGRCGSAVQLPEIAGTLMGSCQSRVGEPER